MASSRHRARWLVVALALLAGTAMLVGVWAQFFPRGFYTSFPSVGGQWVAVDGPYNEHLVRDVGGLNLALAVVTIVALVHRTAVLVRTAALAWLVYSVPHLVYHSTHLDLYDDTDIVLMIASLAMAAVLPAWLFLDADRLTAAPAARPLVGAHMAGAWSPCRAVDDETAPSADHHADHPVKNEAPDEREPTPSVNRRVIQQEVGAVRRTWAATAVMSSILARGWPVWWLRA